jgi:hypothetical protein
MKELRRNGRVMYARTITLEQTGDLYWFVTRDELRTW